MAFGFCSGDGQDLLDEDPRVVRAVAASLAEAFSALELADQDLLALEVAEDFAEDAGGFDQGGADGGAVGSGDEQDVLEDDLGPFGRAFMAIDRDLVALVDAELVATVLDNGVHGTRLAIGRGGPAAAIASESGFRCAAFS